MGILSLWQLVVVAILLFGIVVPAVLAVWMIRLGARRQDRGLELGHAATTDPQHR